VVVENARLDVWDLDGTYASDTPEETHVYDCYAELLVRVKSQSCANHSSWDPNLRSN
jgi:hypothetical protein